MRLIFFFLFFLFYFSFVSFIRIGTCSVLYLSRSRLVAYYFLFVPLFFSLSSVVLPTFTLSIYFNLYLIITINIFAVVFHWREVKNNSVFLIQASILCVWMDGSIDFAEYVDRKMDGLNDEIRIDQSQDGSNRRNSVCVCMFRRRRNRKYIAEISLWRVTWHYFMSNWRLLRHDDVQQWRKKKP